MRPDDDSDSDGPLPETNDEILQEKNRILIEKLYRKEQEVKELKEAVDLIQNDSNLDNKERRIIELAKKNRDL